MFLKPELIAEVLHGAARRRRLLLLLPRCHRGERVPIERLAGRLHIGGRQLQYHRLEGANNHHQLLEVARHPRLRRDIEQAHDMCTRSALKESAIRIVEK